MTTAINLLGFVLLLAVYVALLCWFISRFERKYRLDEEDDYAER